MDSHYKAQVFDAARQAIILTSVDVESNIAVVHNAEASLACLMGLAVLLAGSAATDTPEKTQSLCDVISKRLASMIAEVRTIVAEGGAPCAAVRAEPDEPANASTLH